ncbi:MAG: outer membrane lipoprotein LolB [Burkholderiales bacterium]|nr:outer membrane lipoprotein LolB [Burkholderiales bacterium]HET8693989.1 lipoprotein insertase outer membrane protein LolB [Aquabacterium sp.]
MKRLLRWGMGLPLTSLLLLSGCQTLPPHSAPTPLAVQTGHEWQGYFSVKLGPWGSTAAEGQSFTFYLRADQQAAQLDLMTPLGTQLAQVRWAPSGTWIQSAQGTQSYSSLDDLSVHLLGETVPLQALPHWLNGQPSPDLPAAQPLANRSGFEQAGWAIDTQSLPDGYLQATRPETSSQRQITIKVRLER